MLKSVTTDFTTRIFNSEKNQVPRYLEFDRDFDLHNRQLSVVAERWEIVEIESCMPLGGSTGLARANDEPIIFLIPA